MKNKLSLEELQDYEFFELLKREHERYETNNIARNVRHLISESGLEEIAEDEVVKKIQRIFF